MPVEKPHMVRIYAETWSALVGLAKKNRRSVAAEIAVVLEQHIEMQEGWPE